MKLHRYAWSVLLSLAVLPSTGIAGDVLLGVSGSKIGDLGESYGVEAAYRFHPAVRARLGYSEFDYQQSRTFTDFSVVQKLEQKNPRLTIDWFPWKARNGFYASAGITQLSDPSVITANFTKKIAIFELPDGTENHYSSAALGNITGRLETNENLPYFGVGYIHYFSPIGKSGWYAQVEVGHVSGLDPKLTLVSSNQVKDSAIDLQRYADQQNKLFEDSYTVYGLTVGYRF